MIFSDAFCDGGVTIEILGANARATWHVMHGPDRVPLVSIIVPVDGLYAIAQKFAATALLKREDFIGPAAGRA